MRKDIILEVGVQYKDLRDFLQEIIESGELNEKDEESPKVNGKNQIEEDDGR